MVGRLDASFLGSLEFLAIVASWSSTLGAFEEIITLVAFFV